MIKYKNKIKKIIIDVSILLIIISILSFCLTFSVKKILLYENYINIRNTNKNVTIKSASDENFIFSNYDLQRILKNTYTLNYKENIKILGNNSYYRLNMSGYASEKLNNAFYDGIYNPEIQFQVLSESEFEKINLIGKIPQNKNEVIIHKILADYIIEKGIAEFTEDGSNIIFYKPNNYDEIINSNTKIKFGKTYLVITGIIDENLEKYDILKTISYKNATKDYADLYIEFKEKYLNQIYTMLVKKDFFSSLEIEENNSIDNNIFISQITYNNQKYDNYLNLNTFFDTSNDVFTEDDKSLIELQDNEVVIDINFVNIITNGKFGNEYFKWLKNGKTNYDNYKDELKIFIKNFLSDENIINTNLELSINNGKNKYNMIIKGIRIDNLNVFHGGTEYDKDFSNVNSIIIGGNNKNYEFYFSENIINKYKRNNLEIVSLKVEINSYKNLEELFNLISSNNEFFIEINSFDNKMNLNSYVTQIIYKIKYASVIIFIFGLTILTILTVITFYYKIQSKK